MSNYQASVQFIKKKCRKCGNKTLKAYQINYGKVHTYCPKCGTNYK